MPRHHLGVGGDDLQQGEDGLVDLSVQPAAPLRQAAAQAGDLFGGFVDEIFTGLSLPPLTLGTAPALQAPASGRHC